MKRKKFSDYLIKNKILTPEELEKVLTVHKKRGGSLVELLVKLGYKK